MPAPRLRQDRLRGHDHISLNFPIVTRPPCPARAGGTVRWALLYGICRRRTIFFPARFTFGSPLFTILHPRNPMGPMR